MAVYGVGLGCQIGNTRRQVWQLLPYVEVNAPPTRTGTVVLTPTSTA